MSNKNYYVNPHAVVDDGVELGEGTKVWHFSHVQSGAKIGKKCVIGEKEKNRNSSQKTNNMICYLTGQMVKPVSVAPKIADHVIGFQIGRAHV